ncbi:prokineticin-2 [Latimeria chalumnae]|nr:PREDICTED: prokineticin-2 [Latimeria chalumnae]|eukprot:XP_006009143.1 PREDICTED: prokineticin-2 [Latimeria chalumnae]
MRTVFAAVFFFLLLARSHTVVITGVCNKDHQCGGGMCCAVSIWIKGVRICTPMAKEGEECHPLSHKVPYFGIRMHHTCPCIPNLACIRIADGRYKCLPEFKNQNIFF